MAIAGQRANVLGRTRLLATVLCVVAVAMATSPGEAATRYKRSGDATLGGADALAGVREACEIAGHRVWVSVEDRGDCIAFYPTAGLAGAARAVFYFEGDVPASYRRDVAKLARHLAHLREALEKLATHYKVPYVVVARPGTFGSTGDHGERRKDREYLIMNSAIDGIKARYGLQRIALAGQSGGATVAGALLTLGRTDIACASPASGGYDLNAMLDWHALQQKRHAPHREHPATLWNSYNVMDHIAGVVRDPERRIFIVGDRQDSVTPFAQQKRFADALAAAGHATRLVEAEGSGAQRHGLTGTSLRIAGLCASGASDEAILQAARR